MNTQITTNKEENIFIVGVTNESEEYFLWQREDDSKTDIYFEYNEQINSGYNIIAECTVMLDGIHLVLSSGKLLHFYFNNLPYTEYKKFVESLKFLYSEQHEILEVLDKK